MKGFPIIKLEELRKSAGQSKAYSLVLDGAQIEAEFPSVTLSHPIILEVNLKFENDLYFLSGQLSSTMTLECSRCLKLILYQLNYKIDERFSTKTDEDDDIIILDKDEINLLEIIREVIEFSIPQKALCKDNCLGLCPNCGCNLNISKCQCKQNNIDPRLAILKDLIKE